MTVKTISAEERSAIKEQRARDAELAMRDYRAEKLAVGERTERLRALRLAKEAQNVPAASKKKAAKKIG